jgi:hypothetical protein
MRVPDRAVFIFRKEAAHPAHTLAFHDVVGVDQLVQIGQVSDVPADHDRGVGQMLTNQLAHLLDLSDVRLDRSDPDDVVRVRSNLLDEAIHRREIQQRTGSVDIVLNEHQPPRAVEHPHRERSLLAGYLVVVELHRDARRTAGGVDARTTRLS